MAPHWPLGTTTPHPERIACHHFVPLSEHTFLLYSLQILLDGSRSDFLHHKKTAEAKILVLLTNYQSQLWKGGCAPKMCTGRDQKQVSPELSSQVTPEIRWCLR